MGGLNMSDYISREAMSETPKCPYCESESETGCMSALNADALAYIERLEAERRTEGRTNEAD